MSGITSGAIAIAAGLWHTCAVTVDGAVKCWGGNSEGQLGDGTVTDRTTPVDVAGLTSGVVALSAGNFHTCALTTDGAVKCWGLNSRGQLGDDTQTNHTTPVNVVGLTNGVTGVSTGKEHTCAVTTADEVKCWGANFNGALGDGTTLDRSLPVDVVELPNGVIAVSAGWDFTCAVTEGGVKCWGLNSRGQLGDGTKLDRSLPVDVVDSVGR